MSHGFGAIALLVALSAGQAGAQAALSPTHYDLAVEINFAREMLRGTAGIEMVNPSKEPVREVSLLLYRLLHVGAVHDSQGNDLAFKQAVVAFEDEGRLQVNQVVVTLAQPLAPGTRTTVELRYDGYLLGYTETGMLYVKDRIDSTFTILRDDAFAYPEPGYPSFAVMHGAPEASFSYSARITVPKGFTVANGGRLEGVDSLGDQVTFRYASLKPSWRMDFAIAKYTELTAGTVRVYHLPGDAAGAAGVVEAARKSFDLYTGWFGPLHGSAALTFIEIPDGWGSQADVTTIIQSAAAFKNPKQHREVYHEISHLWNVSPTDRPSPRWNEGLASFLEYLVTEKLSGERVVDDRADLLLAWVRKMLPDHPEWKQVPMIDYGRKDMTDLSYSEGAMFFDLLYRIAGPDAFNTMIGKYHAEFIGPGGSTKDFAAVMRRSTKIDLSPLITDWIDTTGWTERVEQNARWEDVVAYYRRGHATTRK